MQFLRLSTLSLRRTAALVPLVALIILRSSLSASPLAYAFELESRIPPDHNHPVGIDRGYNLGIEQLFTSRPDEYDDSNKAISPRAPAGETALANNDPQNRNIDAGETQNWVFPKEAIAGPAGESGAGLPSDDGSEADSDSAARRRELRKRQDGKMVYLTLNTCAQPVANSSRSEGDAGKQAPPQLQLWVSQSASLTKPGPSTQGDEGQEEIRFDGGYAIFQVSTVDDIYIGLSAPTTSDFSGVWNYEIAASIDAPFHAIGGNSTQLFFVDGDNHAALLVTDDMTQTEATSEVFKQWMAIEPPYGVFAHNRNDGSILGLHNSFCGLKRQSQIAANIKGVGNRNVARMVDRGGMGGKPKQEFYIGNLNASSDYHGFLAMQGNSTGSGAGVVGGGGKIWNPPVNFSTKTEANCALVYNLSFCDEVAYAVPSNPDLFDPASEDGMGRLGSLYDSHASEVYRSFNYSLQQIPCQAPPLQQYSLVRNCADCARAYKTWLCAVTIPRCEDFTSTKAFLMPRNVAANVLNDNNNSSSSSSSSSSSGLPPSKSTNSSRNPLIDADVRPGPYKEVLPCQDLCYDLMQSCPASLGFRCPLPGKGLDVSYGRRNDDEAGGRWDGEVTCSHPGAVHFDSAAVGSWMRPSSGLGSAVMVMVTVTVTVVVGLDWI